MNASLPSSLRLFLALWPTDEVRGAILRWAEGWGFPAGAARVAPQRVHLTLHFIGNVPAARLDELRAGLQVPVEPIDLSLGAGELWHGGIAVLRVEGRPAALLRLQAALGRALRALALPVEARPYRPHVTLARRAAGATPPPPAGIGWRASQGYVLVRSAPAAGGYERLHHYA